VERQAQGQLVRELLLCDISYASINNIGSCFESRYWSASRNIRWMWSEAVTAGRATLRSTQSGQRRSTLSAAKAQAQPLRAMGPTDAAGI
jgi:hypothetical protein